MEGFMSDVTIRAIPNGPLRATGPFKVIDAKGNECSIEEGRTISLCRCGGSSNKPFCDGTHGRTGFEADQAAVTMPAPKPPESAPSP